MYYHRKLKLYFKDDILGFNAGKVPNNPALQEAMTNSGPDTRNMGATITGNFSFDKSFFPAALPDNAMT